MSEKAPREDMWEDPIVAEVRAVRERLFAEAGYDLAEFCRRARERQASSGHRVVTNADLQRSRDSHEAA